MISGPFVHVILERHGVGNDKEDPQGQPCLVSSVAPEAMSPGCDAQSAGHVVENPEEAGVELAGGNQYDPVQASQVQQDHENDVPPDVLQLGRGSLLILIGGVVNIFFHFRTDVFFQVEGHRLHLLSFISGGRCSDGGGGRVRTGDLLEHVGRHDDSQLLASLSQC